MLSNRNDLKLYKKPVSQVAKNETPIYRVPCYKPYSKSEFQSEFPVISPRPSTAHPLRRQTTEMSKERPWPIKILQSRQVQTEPQPAETTSSVSNGLPQLKTDSRKQQQTTNTDSSLFLKKQESSNFSLFKGMNSNDLCNYIDDVINEFRAKTRLMEEDAETEQVDGLAEFSDTIFYPDDRDIVNIEMRRPRIGERINLQDLSTIMSSDNEAEVDQSQSKEGNFLQSRSFTNTKDSPNDDLEDEAESSTFINYTHSFEIDESNGEDDVTLDELIEK